MSRLFIYYNQRELEGEAALDHDAKIRVGITVLKYKGACCKETWPYDPVSVALQLPSVEGLLARINRRVEFSRYSKQGLNNSTPRISQLDGDDSIDNVLRGLQDRFKFYLAVPGVPCPDKIYLLEFLNTPGTMRCLHHCTLKEAAVILTGFRGCFTFIHHFANRAGKHHRCANHLSPGVYAGHPSR